MKRIYLDYASLTPIDKRVAKEIKKYSDKKYGNPSALYASAVNSKKAILDAKKRIANILHAHPDEIIFTGSGTEANELAVKGKRVVISAIEHSSIIDAAKNATVVGVDVNGVVDLEALKKAITPETELVSVVLVNNEIGTIEPIQEVAKVVRDAKKKFGTNILLHTDACQAGLLPLHVEKLGVDLMTLDGHKLYGPRGVGALYVRRGVMEHPRQGTANVPGIMGFAVALEITDKMRDKEYKRLSDFKNYFISEIKKEIPDVKVNGGTETSPHILNISIPNIDNEFFVLKMDAAGIECSTKSACLRDEDESYVLKAIGADSKTSIRFSFGRNTSKSELKKAAKAVILTAWSISRNSK